MEFRFSKLMFTALLVFLFVLVCALGGGLAAVRDVRPAVEPLEDSQITKGRFTLGPGSYEREIRFGGQKRFYQLYVPASYDKDQATPVVMVFHGGGSDPGAVRYESRMDETAARNGFIAVYPAGHRTKWYLKDRLLLWNDGRPDESGKVSDVDDVGFVVALLDDLGRLFHIDPQRIYASGYSNGAQFTYRLVKRLTGRFAAMAAVAGNRPVKDAYDPAPSGPIPVMQFSGLKDPISPYWGGTPPEGSALTGTIQPVPETMQTWVGFNGCPTEPETRRFGQAVRKKWGPCRCGTVVVLWTLEDGGHTWPGGRIMPNVELLGLGNLGGVNQDITASDQMWDFFKPYTVKPCENTDQK